MSPYRTPFFHCEICVYLFYQIHESLICGNQVPVSRESNVFLQNAIHSCIVYSLFFSISCFIVGKCSMVFGNNSNKQFINLGQ